MRTKFNMIGVIFLLKPILITASKSFSGQRVFTDAHIIDFADPAKHGFHIVLNENFVNTHLQPIRLPTLFATAIALKHSQLEKRKNDTTPSPLPQNAASLNDGNSRVTKILYPENVNQDDGLLDGRTIKLLGLRERSWYYVCVEFESNLNRHELAVGASCQLKRTLDKFGKTTDSAVGEFEISHINDRSISIKLKIDVDFPIKLSVYLKQDSRSNNAQSVPSQTFILDQARTLNVLFAHLDSDTAYGSVCILEEPIPMPTGVYTATGRAVVASMHHCIFENLKTTSQITPVVQKVHSKERHPSKSFSPALHVEHSTKTMKLEAGKRALPNNSTHPYPSWCIFTLFLCLILAIFTV